MGRQSPVASLEWTQLVATAGIATLETFSSGPNSNSSDLVLKCCRNINRYTIYQRSPQCACTAQDRPSDPLPHRSPHASLAHAHDIHQGIFLHVATGFFSAQQSARSAQASSRLHQPTNRMPPPHSDHSFLPSFHRRREGEDEESGCLIWSLTAQIFPLGGVEYGMRCETVEKGYMWLNSFKRTPHAQFAAAAGAAAASRRIEITGKRKRTNSSSSPTQSPTHPCDALVPLYSIYSTN